jgi:hypothetical protein
VRGWINYSDAFIPLALLHLGNSQNLLWIFTINFILSVALIYGLLLCIILSSGSLTVNPFVGAAVCLILLPLCGASGLPYIPLLGLWLVYAAVLHWRSGQAKGKRNALLILSLTLTSWVIFTLYWYGYTKPAHHPSSSSVAALLRTSLEFISMSLGPATLTLWPYAAFAVLAFLVSGAAGAILMLRSRPEKRVAILGLLLFLGACIALALGIGWGRAFRGALWERYATLAAPVLFCVYFIWVLCKRPTPAQLGQMSLFTLFCMLFPINTLDGIDWAARHRQRMEAFRNDLEAGVPAPLLAEEHPDVCPVVPNELPVPPFITNGMHLLHESGFPPFKHLNETDYEAVPFTSPPIVVSQMTWDKAEGIATGPDPSLVFALPSARYVYAVRLKYSLSNPRGVPATLRVFWKDDEQDFSTSERNLTMTVETGPEEQTVLIGVNGLIRQFRIDPGAKPGFFRVAQIELVMRPS